MAKRMEGKVIRKLKEKQTNDDKIKIKEARSKMRRNEGI